MEFTHTHPHFKPMIFPLLVFLKAWLVQGPPVQFPGPTTDLLNQNLWQRGEEILITLVHTLIAAVLHLLLIPAESHCIYSLILNKYRFYVLT